MVRYMFSKEYFEFDASRIDFRKNITKSLRLTLSLFIIVYIVAVIPFSSPDALQIFSAVGAFSINFLLSSLVLRKKFERFSGEYISLILLVIPLLSTEACVELMQRATTVIQMSKFLFIGLIIGTISSIFSLSKVPFKYYLLFSLASLVYIISRQYTTSIESPHTTTSLSTFLTCMMIFHYYWQERTEYELWAILRKKHMRLLQFQRLIQIFPSMVVLFNKQSIKIDKPLYMNEEARKIFGNQTEEELTLTMFLEMFKIDQIERSISFGMAPTLKNLVMEIMKSNPGDEREYETYLATLLESQKLFPNSTSLDSSPSQVGQQTSNLQNNQISSKFEIKVGWLNWEDEETVILILNDISKSEKIRELKILHENKDKLLSTFSHELRTPLNGIIGMVDIAQAELSKDNHNVDKYLEIAGTSAKVLLLMINAILDISLIQRGKLVMNFETVPLHNLIEQVLVLVSGQIRNKGLVLEYENPYSKSIQTHVDVVRFKQILINLLVNACKFTQRGKVKLKVVIKRKRPEVIAPKNIFRKFSIASREPQRSFTKSFTEDIPLISKQPIRTQENIEIDLRDNPGQSFKAQIYVEDTGSGIKDENLPSMFNLFSKFDATPGTGSGLGLALSQCLVQQMSDSRIKVKTKYGEGSIFWFSVNVTQNGELNEYPDISEERSPYTCHSNFDHLLNRKKSSEVKLINLLVVDDDQVNHLVIEQYIKSLPKRITYTKAFNGAEAVDFIERHAGIEKYFDAILMDCDMPVMNGFQASRKICDLMTTGRIPPLRIIALTANISASDKELCERSGMKDVWTKPITKKEFTDRMNAIFDEM